MLSASVPDGGGIGGGIGSGQQFLSSAGIDTQSLFRRARDLQSRSISGAATGTAGTGTGAGTGTTSQQPQSQLGGHPTSTSAVNQNQNQSQSTNVELLPNLHESLQQSRAATIQNILLQQRNKTHGIVQQKIQSRLQDNFRRTVLSLGHVVPGSSRRVNGLDGHGPDGGRDSGSSNQMAPLASVLASASASASAVDWNSQLLQSHLKLFDPNNAISTHTHNRNHLQELSQVARDNHHAAYSNAITLFQTITMSTSTNTAARVTARGRTIASLQFLSHQFQNYILSQVKNQAGGVGASASSNNNNVGMGMGMGTGGLLGYIHKFVEMEMGPTAVSQGQAGVMWRMVYYALRCGDLSCVKDILCSGTVVEVEDVLVRYIAEACQVGQSQSQGRDGKVGIEALGEVNSNMVDAVGELYRRVESRSMTSRGAGSTYEVAVLALLSFTPMENTTVSSQVQNTSEDYIFMGLWNAIRARSGAGPGAGAADEEGIDTVCALVENVKHYGPAHFEDGSGQDDGWVYAMLLLLCQQYRSGLGYLAGKSIEGLCVAVHLGLALREEGIALTDLSKSSDAIVAAPVTATSAATATSEDDLATLVMAFAKSLQTVSPSSSLDYLVRLPGEIETGIELKNGQRLTKNGQDQICRLLIDTKAFSVLGGRMAPDGSRLASGSLDKHFANRGVSDILASAADQSMREGKTADTAELLSLAGRYSDLLSVLNRQLSNLLVTDNLNERKFWRDAAVNFHQTYLSQGQTHVLQVLESDRNLSLGNTFQMLLNLMSFFDRCNDGQWEVSNSLYTCV